MIDPNSGFTDTSSSFETPMDAQEDLSQVFPLPIEEVPFGLVIHRGVETVLSENPDGTRMRIKMFARIALGDEYLPRPQFQLFVGSTATHKDVILYDSNLYIGMPVDQTLNPRYIDGLLKGFSGTSNQPKVSNPGRNSRKRPHYKRG